MIDKSNFKDVLRYLDFEESGDIFIHRYANSAYLKIDFNKKMKGWLLMSGKLVTFRKMKTLLSSNVCIVY